MIHFAPISRTCPTAAGWRMGGEIITRRCRAGPEYGLRDGEPYASFHRAIAVAGENTARLSEKLMHYKVQTAMADVGKFTRGGWYRASSAVSTLIGDARIREPRAGAALITPELVAALQPRLAAGRHRDRAAKLVSLERVSARLLAAFRALRGNRGGTARDGIRGGSHASRNISIRLPDLMRRDMRRRSSKRSAKAWCSRRSSIRSARRIRSRCCGRG